MEATGTALILLLAVVVSGYLARLAHLPAPLVQLALGAGMTYAGVGAVVLDPDIFFLLFLPPLLFLDGWRLPKDALRRDAATILMLALGLVLFTVLGMGVFIHWLIPSTPLAVAFALAAVIAPTDPVAVSAIAARTPVPARLMHILQGESLLNDASGLVCMRFAVAAALTGLLKGLDIPPDASRRAVEDATRRVAARAAVQAIEAAGRRGDGQPGRPLPAAAGPPPDR